MMKYNLALKLQFKIVALLLFFNVMFDCRVSGYYKKQDTIIVESENFILLHTYNWSDSTLGARIEMMLDTVCVFNKKFPYSSLILIDKNTGDTIFNKSSPALTFLTFSSDENFIIGLSNIGSANPYHIVVLSTKGGVILRRYISSIESKLDSSQYEYFKLNYSDNYKELLHKGKVFFSEGYCYISFTREFKEERFAEAFQYLSEEIEHVTNHLTPAHFSMKLDISFYQKDDPISEIKINNGRFEWLKLNGKKNNEFKLYPD